LNGKIIIIISANIKVQNITLHVAQIVNTEQLQQYTAGDKTGCRYINLNTLHNCGNKDDDDDTNNNNQFLL